MISRDLAWLSFDSGKSLEGNINKISIFREGSLGLEEDIRFNRQGHLLIDFDVGLFERHYSKNTLMHFVKVYFLRMVSYISILAVPCWSQEICML